MRRDELPLVLDMQKHVPPFFALITQPSHLNDSTSQPLNYYVLGF